MLMCSCQGPSKVSELEKVTVVAEPQPAKNNSSVSQENSLENEDLTNNRETEEKNNYTENDENISSIETPLETQTKQVWIEENFGWALTTDNEILYTENGVEEFVPIKKNELTGYPQRICFYNEDNGYIAVTYHGEN